jgi:hypothetical protein
VLVRVAVAVLVAALVGVLVLTGVLVGVLVGVAMGVFVLVDVFVGVARCKSGCAETLIGPAINSATIIHSTMIAVSGLRFTAFPPLDQAPGSFPRKV